MTTNKNMLKPFKRHLYFILYLFICFPNVYGQNQPAVPSLRELLQLAETNYPLLKSKALDIQAAQKSVDIGKATIIPSLDASYQANYEWVDVRTGINMGDKVEIFGDLNEGDLLLVRASDEIKPGAMPVTKSSTIQ